ncbi:MAG TPA: PhoX family phosphatase [Candidatus Tectomicrobia bacterium]|nr:PhoX family phosphatase [Candidatus Tectomicrobia bacterium]
MGDEIDHEAHEENDDLGTSNPSQNDTFESVLQIYMSRRTLLQGAMASLVLVYANPLLRAVTEAGTAGFMPLTHSTEDKLLIPPGYESQVVIRWGDPLLPETSEFDPRAQTPAKQARQFGYNADFIGFLPLPYGTQTSAHGLLVVNLEYTNGELMFASWDGKPESKTRDMVDIEIAAHGLAVVEVQRGANGGWSYVPNSPFNRRLTAESPMLLSGPAAGHPWLKTSYDSSGALVRGTLNNCAAVITPWGTVLTAEENFNLYFADAIDNIVDASVRSIHKRYGLHDQYGWARYHDRFDVGKEPNEALRFGWVVEVDPYDPRSVPVKRTALGRTKHEAATVVITKGGQAVVYSGDDERFEYLYKFVSAGCYDSTNRAANMRLLDSGTLYVAKFRDDGTGEWLPLIFGLGPLTPANGFASQAEVLINTRRAADLLGATKMDRPEDVEASPKTGRVYALMTNNARRQPEQVDKANPRAENKHGQIIEMIEDEGEHAATKFRWELFIACGDPNRAEDNAFYQGHQDVSWMSCPDNIAFDDAGRLWVATDGQPASIDKNDAVYMVEVEGPRHGLAKMFLSGLPGGEVCGPAFTPDNRTLFIAIQHPGEAKESTFANPISRFPDYSPDMPPRPSVVAIYRVDGGKVGS